MQKYKDLLNRQIYFKNCLVITKNGVNLQCTLQTNKNTMENKNTPATAAAEQKESKTMRQFGTMSSIYDYYNEKLFGGQLPQCLVNMSRHKGAAGFFMANNWKDVEKHEESKDDIVELLTGEASKHLVHEISICPDAMKRPAIYWHATIVHEMVHLWQQDFGKPPRKCYHDKQFAAKMKEVGLTPSHTGAPGGKETGSKMSDYPTPGGIFEAAFKEIEHIKLPFLPNAFRIGSVQIIGEPENEDGTEAGESQPKLSGKKFKYECECDEPNRVWGKSGLDLQCNSCDKKFTEM